MWSFDLATSRWTPLPPATAAQPAARDHHGAALSGSRLYIFGGRFGTVAEAGRPLGDRWVFDLDARTWWQLPVRGLSPLPRHMFGYAQFAPPGAAADQLIIFGGQTGGTC